MKRARVRTDCGIAKVGVRAYPDISDAVVRYLYPGDEFTFEPDDYKNSLLNEKSEMRIT